MIVRKNGRVRFSTAIDPDVHAELAFRADILRQGSRESIVTDALAAHFAAHPLTPGERRTAAQVAAHAPTTEGTS